MLLDFRKSKEEKDISELSDKEVLALSIKKPAHFEEIVLRYEEKLLRKARKVLGTPENAEDAVQETFTKVYMHAGRFKEVEGASFNSWIYKILMNTCFTQYRKVKRVRENVIDTEFDLYSIIPDQDKDFELNEIYDYVASVLSKMPLHLSEVLQLHFIKGLSQKEIAEQQGTTVGAIKTRIYRAKESFRANNT